MSVAFLYPGQGAQKVGMAKDLYEGSEFAKERFEKANEILGFDITSIILEDPEEQLGQTNFTQPALFLVESIITDMLKAKGVTPAVTMGHSLGEYSALYGAGVFSFEDGLKLVAKRGELMANAGETAPGTMAAIIGLEKSAIVETLKAVESGVVVTANENSPVQTVISGEVAAVTEACEKLSEAGAKRAIVLKVSGAFHSPLMQAAADEFRKTLEGVNFSDPQCPVIANVTASEETSGEALKSLLIDQLLSPVRWVESEATLQAKSCEIILEVGPGKVLRGLARDFDRKMKVTSCGTFAAVEEIC